MSGHDDYFGYHDVPNLERQVRRAERVLGESLLALDRIRSYGDDVYEVGAVITFDKTYPDGRTFAYAAIKSRDGYWYTTGPLAHAQPRTWGELIGWLGIPPHPTETGVWLVTDLLRIDS